MLKKSEFTRNSIVLIVGTGFSQLIPLLVQPFIRRIFTDEEFGLYAQYLSLVSILAIIAGLKFENSIVIPKSNRAAINLLSGTILVNLMFSILLFIILFLFGEWIFEMIGFSAGLNAYKWLLPISVFLVSFNISVGFWMTRNKEFGKVVVNKISRRGTEALSRLGLGISKYSGGLFIGSVIGDFVNMLVSIFQFKKYFPSLKNVTKKGMKTNLSEQSEFPKHSLFPALLSVVTAQLPIFLFTGLFSDAVVGQYSGTREILSAPLVLISVSISQVLYQRLVENINQGIPISTLLKKNMLFLGGLGLFGILVFYPFGVQIFEFIFGDEWTLAGRLSEILVFSFVIKFIVSPLSVTFLATKRLKVMAYWQIGYFLLTLNMFWFTNITIEKFAIYFVILDLVTYLIYLLLIFNVAKKSDQKQLKLNSETL